MRDRLQKMAELAQQHMAETQRYQKVWYDKSARQRTFVPGQKVLVMLPTNANCWQNGKDHLRWRNNLDPRLTELPLRADHVPAGCSM